MNETPTQEVDRLRREIGERQARLATLLLGYRLGGYSWDVPASFIRMPCGCRVGTACCNSACPHLPVVHSTRPQNVSESRRDEQLEKI